MTKQHWIIKLDEKIENWITNNRGKWFVILIFLGIGLAYLQGHLLGSFQKFKIMAFLYPMLLVIVELFANK